MAEDLAQELEKFHLMKKEDIVVGQNLRDLEETNTDEKISLMMVGKMLTKRPFNFEATKRTLHNVWRLKEGVVIQMVETNLFAFQFSSSIDKENIKNGMPWFFDNQLLLLKEVKGDEQLSKYAMFIGENMGGFLEMDDSNRLGLDNILRIKVMVDVGKPLRRGMKIATNTNSSKWVYIKCERLGDFCYFCGKVRHVDRDCEAIDNEEVEKKEMVYRYGPWMRASPLRRGRTTEEESANEKMLLNKIKNKRGGHGKDDKGNEKVNAVAQNEVEGSLSSWTDVLDGGAEYGEKNGVKNLGGDGGIEYHKEVDRVVGDNGTKTKVGKWKRLVRGLNNGRGGLLNEGLKKAKNVPTLIETDDRLEVAEIGEAQPREEP
ncbi:hypothetical protein RDABS01_030448 [Bienertia sinuspersici]